MYSSPTEKTRKQYTNFGYFRPITSMPNFLINKTSVQCEGVFIPYEKVSQGMKTDSGEVLSDNQLNSFARLESVESAESAESTRIQQLPKAMLKKIKNSYDNINGNNLLLYFSLFSYFLYEITFLLQHNSLATRFTQVWEESAAANGTPEEDASLWRQMIFCVWLEEILKELTFILYSLSKSNNTNSNNDLPFTGKLSLVKKPGLDDNGIPYIKFNHSYFLIVKKIALSSRQLQAAYNFPAMFTQIDKLSEQAYHEVVNFFPGNALEKSFFLQKTQKIKLKLLKMFNQYAARFIEFSNPHLNAIFFDILLKSGAELVGLQLLKSLPYLFLKKADIVKFCRKQYQGILMRNSYLPGQQVFYLYTLISINVLLCLAQFNGKRIYGFPLKADRSSYIAENNHCAYTQKYSRTPKRDNMFYKPMALKVKRTTSASHPLLNQSYVMVEQSYEKKKTALKILNILRTLCFYTTEATNPYHNLPFVLKEKIFSYVIKAIDTNGALTKGKINNLIAYAANRKTITNSMPHFFKALTVKQTPDSPQAEMATVKQSEVQVVKRGLG